MYPRTPSPVGIRGVEDYPNINNWVERMVERIAVQKGLKAGEELWGNPPLTDEERKDLFLGKN